MSDFTRSVRNIYLDKLERKLREIEELLGTKKSWSSRVELLKHQKYLEEEIAQLKKNGGAI